MEKEAVANIARQLYLEEGYSCSTSLLLALKKAGIDIPDSIILSVAGLRSGIGGAGCVCGALMASVLTVGYLYGKTDEKKASKLSANLHNKFKEQFKSTCCRVLTRKYSDFKSLERKEHCAGLVEFMILELQKIEG
ncbi:C_GCAxxG_C_C family protein [Candidatus Saganbacteria bacterium]|nr:C_GCAxxG_C_C family protein [Candidatus Saganbacteria bacterium]